MRLNCQSHLHVVHPVGNERGSDDRVTLVMEEAIFTKCQRLLWRAEEPVDVSGHPVVVRVR